jgi:hypothetical protein
MCAAEPISQYQKNHGVPMTAMTPHSVLSTSIGVFEFKPNDGEVRNSFAAWTSPSKSSLAAIRTRINAARFLLSLTEKCPAPAALESVHFGIARYLPNISPSKGNTPGQLLEQTE